MDNFLIQTYYISLPIVLGYIVWLLQNQKKTRGANGKGTMLLLRVHLIEYHDKYMERGSIPRYALDNFCEMYKQYCALGGNGMVKRMYEDIKRLKIENKK